MPSVMAEAKWLGKRSDEFVTINIVEIITMSKPNRDTKKKMDDLEEEVDATNIAPGITESLEEA